jgi:hypothetical protein
MDKDGIDELDEEIESAVDSLFVERGADSEGGSARRITGIPEGAETIPDISPEVMEASLERDTAQEAILEPEPVEEEVTAAPEPEPGGEELKPPPEPELTREDVTPLPQAEPLRQGPAAAPIEIEPIEKPPGDEKLPKDVETLEVELLSLEWEFNPETIKRIIAALGGLKAAYRDDDPLLQVINMMGKVSLYLLNDEKSVTPEALRFLQDGKEIMKFLITEKEQTVFKSLVTEGITSHFHQLGLGGGEKREKVPAERLMQKLCLDLERDRMRLYEGQDHLLKALRQFEERKEELIFDDGLRGIRDELERIQGYLKSSLGHLGHLSDQLQRELFGEKVYGGERVLLVETHNRIFGVPSGSVVKSYAFPEDYARTVALRNSITLKGKSIPLVRLSDLFNLGATPKKMPRGVVLVGKGNQIVALLVDRVLTSKNLLISSEERESRKLKYVTAISQLEGGRTVYILNVDRLTGRVPA